MSQKKIVQSETAKGIQDEPQIIAEFHIQTSKERNQMLIEQYNNCELCGTEMIFTHVTQFTFLQVEEEAFCPHCNMSTITQTHSLQ